MSEDAPTQTTPKLPLSPSLATSLARWEDEGGAPSEPWVLNALSNKDRRILESLGAAIVSIWNDLPTDIQRKVFQHAIAEAAFDPTLLAEQIARFLHDHKDDTGAA